ncbi:MAG TPA: MFS transporter [Parvibaculum sp.]|jgi:MFS family permease
MSLAKKSGWGELMVEGRLSRFALLCLGIWLNAADSLMTATIMPSVAADIGGYAYFGWTIAGFILGAILAGASAGQISMRLGLRLSMVLAAAVYTVGCIVSAEAPEIATFLTGRLLQGIGAGWVVGLCYVAIGTMFPESLWARVMASISGVWGAATLLSPLIGGLFAEAGLWRGAFWIFAVQGIGFGFAAFFLLSPTKPQGVSDAMPVRQLAVLAGGILCIAAAGLVPDILRAVLLSISGLILLGLFVRIDRRARSPLLPRSAGDLMSAAGSGYMMIFTLAAASIGFSVYGSVIMQVLFGTSPLVAGYILGVESMSWTLCALAVAGLADRWHGLFIKLGALAVVIGVASLAVTMRSGPLVAIAAASLFLGGGFGLSWAFIARRIITSVGDGERALASSAVPTVQMIGYAAGSAGAGVIANFLGFAGGIDAATATRASFWLFASFVPVALVGLAAAWRLAACEPDQMSLRAESSSLM